MTADLILLSSNIYPGIGSSLYAGYIAIKEDKIISVGRAASYESFVGADTKILDYKDHLIIPGMHDAHLHAFMSGLYADPKVRVCYTDTSEEACVQGLKDIEDLVPKDQWMISAGWCHSQWDNPVLPTKYSLDRVYPDRPVCLVSFDCHTMWINSFGMKKLGIDRNTPDFPGGTIDKDEHGEPLGVFHDGASTILTRYIYQFPEEEIAGFYKNFMRILNSYGITSICDVSMVSTPGMDFVRDDIYSRMEQDGTLSVRVHMYPPMLHGMERAISMREKYRGPLLYCNGVKQFFDGVSCCHTAYLRDPYANAYYPGDVGSTSMPPEEMREQVLEAHQKGFSIRVHTIGDQAIHLMLDYCEEAEKIYGYKPEIRHTLEHLENFIPSDIPRIGSSHVLPSVQPAHVLCDMIGVERDLGEERVQLMWPFRSLIDAGCTLAFGTDSPVVDINPFVNLYNAVTRVSAYDHKPAGGWHPQECITIWEAVSSYTYGSACAAHAENLYGTIEAGKYADLCVLDHNIFKEDPEILLHTRCLLTMLGGNIVYSA